MFPVISLQGNSAERWLCANRRSKKRNDTNERLRAYRFNLIMTHEDCNALPTTTWNQVLTTVVGSLIAFFSITANALILIAIYKTTALHSVTNYFIASLAVGDLFVGMVALPLWIARSLLQVASEEHPLSVAVDFVYAISVAISTYNLCAVSFERYIGVIYPLRYNSLITTRCCKYVAASVWFISFCIACLRFAITEDDFWITSVSMAFFLPGMVISYCYIRIYKEASRQSRSIRDRSGPILVTQMCNRKASATVAVIIGVFYLTSLPALVFSLTEVVSDDKTSCQEIKFNESWGTWALFFAFSNASLNPMIYATRKREIRGALKLLLCKMPFSV